MALVPDNFDFSLWDVYNVTGYSDLYNSFTYYYWNYIDQYYWNNEIGMRRFRNYGPKGYINVSPNTLSYYQSGTPHTEYWFIVESSVDWTMDIDTSEISAIEFSPNSGNAGTTYVYCNIYSENYHSFVTWSSNTIHNADYTVTNNFSACQDGYYDSCY